VPDLAIAFASYLGPEVKLRWISVGFEEQFFNKDAKVVQEAAYTPELLASGTCDLYATNIVKVPWRSSKFDYVVLNPSRMAVVVNMPMAARIRTPTDLGGRYAATYKDTFYETWLLEQNRSTYASNPIKIRYVDDEEQSIRAVDNGSVDFTLLITDTWVPLAQKYHNCEAAFGVGPILEMGWAFRKEDRNLQRAAQKFFEAQRSTPDSLMNTQYQDAYHMTVDEYEDYVGNLK
jgi:ABC-type amino acid transport substrate-binding protein